MARSIDITKDAVDAEVKLIANINDATILDAQGVDSISYSIPSGASLGAITVYSCLTENGTYQPFEDPDTRQIVAFTPTAGRNSVLNYSTNGWSGFIKLICAGTPSAITVKGKKADGKG